MTRAAPAPSPLPRCGGGRAADAARPAGIGDDLDVDVRMMRTLRRVAFLVLAGAGAVRCSRGEPQVAALAATEEHATAAAPAVAATGDGCEVAALPDRLPAPARLVAIGDLHGDLAAAKAALRAGGLIDDADRWSGGATVLVQTGDVLDRGDDEPEILALIARLEVEAATAGGAVVALAGNHELMNAAGDLAYVTRGGFEDYAAVPAAGAMSEGVPAFARGRVAAFRPGGPAARGLVGRRVVAVVGDTVFAHAGPSAGIDLAAVNRGARCWLAGAGPPPAILDDEDGPVWTRAYGGEAPDCARVAAALAALGARRMVVGHTVQERGINAACDGALWRIDVGMAAAYGGPIEVLELRGDAAKVLRGARR